MLLKAGHPDFGAFVPASLCSISKGSPRTENKQSTEQFDERIAATDQAIVLRLDDGSEVTVIDPGAFELAGDALISIENVLKDSLAFVGTQFDKSFQLVAEANTQQDAKSLKDVLVFGGVIAALAAGAVVYSKGAR